MRPFFIKRKLAVAIPKNDWILSVLDHFAADGNLQALCDDIASTARLRRNDNHDDDITVCACRITKAI